MRVRPELLALCLLPVFVDGSMAATRHASPCVDGLAEGYACSKVDLLAHLDLFTLGTTAGGNDKDMWDWTGADAGKEFALVGLDNGTAFIDISDPHHPLRIGNLATHSSNSTWRDIKTSRPAATTRRLSPTLPRSLRDRWRHAQRGWILRYIAGQRQRELQRHLERPSLICKRCRRRQRHQSRLLRPAAATVPGTGCSERTDRARQWRSAH